MSPSLTLPAKSIVVLEPPQENIRPTPDRSPLRVRLTRSAPKDHENEIIVRRSCRYPFWRPLPRPNQPATSARGRLEAHFLRVTRAAIPAAQLRETGKIPDRGAHRDRCCRQPRPSIDRDQE